MGRTHSSAGRDGAWFDPCTAVIYTSNLSTEKLQAEGSQVLGHLAREVVYSCYSEVYV